MRVQRRIDQLIPAIIEHDAVSNHTFEAQRLLRSMGFDSDIYAAIIGPGAEGRVLPVSSLGAGADGRWLLYQCSIGSPVAEIFARHPGGRILDYHNITPAELVDRWIPPLAAEARLGRDQLGTLAPLVDHAIADSPYNAEELRRFGFASTEVVPVLIEAVNLDQTADPASLDELEAARAPGGSEWLFVGQLAPHKAQHELISVLACYRRVYRERARLHLVGRAMGGAYRDALSRFAAATGVGGDVDLPGSVSPGRLAAYFGSADVFVCLSHHEGFCVPIIEAMARGLPVIAADAAAVPGTIGDAGIVLGRRDPAYVAGAIHELLADHALREDLVVAGRRRAEHFSLANAQDAFCASIEHAIGAATGG